MDRDQGERSGPGRRQVLLSSCNPLRQGVTESKDKNIVSGYVLRHLGQTRVWGLRRGNIMDGTSERLLTPGEVAALFRVDPKTVTRWAASGRISSIRTPGGHRRFRESEVRALLRGEAGTSKDEGQGS